jgi:hypothetical protein
MIVLLAEILYLDFFCNKVRVDFFVGGRGPKMKLIRTSFEFSFQFCKMVQIPKDCVKCPTMDSNKQ